MAGAVGVGTAVSAAIGAAVEFGSWIGMTEAVEKAESKLVGLEQPTVAGTAETAAQIGSEPELGLGFELPQVFVD